MTTSRLRALGTALGVLLAGYGTAGCPWTAAPVDVTEGLEREDAGARSFELRILDPSESLSLVERANVSRGSVWLSEKVLADLPSRARTLDVGSKLYPTGTVTIIAGGEKPRATSASIVSFVEKPAERFLVVGSGNVEVRSTNGVPSLVAVGPDMRVVPIDTALPKACVGTTDAQLSWKAPTRAETFRTIASQTWDAPGACIDVAFEDGEKLAACLPKDAWPFEVGDAVRIPVNGRDERRLEIHGTEAQHDMLALERGELAAESITGTIAVKVDTMSLELSPDESCRSVDPSCGSSRVSARMYKWVDGQGTEVRRGPLGEDKLGVERRWILSAWIEGSTTSSCTPKEEPPAPLGASVEMVVRIKQPRS